MKKIKYLLLSLVMVLMLPSMVSAASGTVKVTGTSTAVLGNNVTVTVTLSSSTAIGAWEMDLNYDRNYLRLTSATSEAGGTMMAGYATSASGVKSKSYTFKFKTIKKGSTKVSVSSYVAYAFKYESELDLTASSKTIKIITQEELEASYSSNANLSSLSVEGYALSPAFNKDTTEYNLEVENAVESVNVSAKVADNTADLSGTGTINLLEGSNKVEIKVTAQKGNIKTYTINIYRKELNPISVEIEGKNYGIVRKDDVFPNYNGFTKTEIDYEGEKIPAMFSEITGKTLLIIKDDDGNLYTIEYEDGEFKDIYNELKSNQLIVNPLPLPKKMDDLYERITIDFNDIKVDAYAFDKTSKTAIIYAQDTSTGDVSYYQVDLENNVISLYDDEITDHYEGIISKYKYVLLGMLGVIVILIIALIFRKPKKIIVSSKEDKEDKKKENHKEENNKDE